MTVAGQTISDERLSELLARLPPDLTYGFSRGADMEPSATALRTSEARSLLTELQHRREAEAAHFAEAGKMVAPASGVRVKTGLAENIERMKRASEFLRQSVTPPAPISNTVRQSIADALDEAIKSLTEPADDEPWRYDLENVPRDRDFLIQFDHKEVTIGRYLDNSKSKWPYEGIQPCRMSRPHRVGEKIVAWREMPRPETENGERV